MKLSFFLHTEAVLLPNSEALPDVGGGWGGWGLPDSTRFSDKMNQFGQGFGGFRPIDHSMVIYRSFIVHTKQSVITQLLFNLFDCPQEWSNTISVRFRKTLGELSAAFC